MYYTRYTEIEIERALNSSGAVLVMGPKFCGKTTTCMRFQKSNIKLNNNQTISIAKMSPKQVLVGERPRLIDEWQTVPEIWNYVKENLDENYQFGSFILTGSSTPAEKTKIHHSGAGRITPIKMRTMSLFESKESRGIVSIKKLFNNESNISYDANDDSKLQDIAFLCCRGGWPISVIAN